MPIISLIVTLLIYIRISDDLHKFQQNSYRIKRYMKWRFSERSRIFRPHELIFLIGLVLAFFSGSLPVKIAGMCLILIDTYFAWLIRTAYPVKKALVYTPRVKRLKATATFLLLIIAYFAYHNQAVGFIIGLTYFVSFIYVFAANTINKPIESRINTHYYNDAGKTLASAPNLRVLGITGSYGKTSTKNIVNSILNKDFNVLMTPESFNTKMGLTRTIRQWLKPIHEVFIAEMGAKEVGDIKELCDFVHPEMGLITSIGPQHLETFKTLENVIRTKGELFDAIPSGGTIFLNCDDENILKLPTRDDVTYYRYAVDHESAALNGISLNLSIGDLVMNAQGAQFTLNYDFPNLGKGSVAMHTKLLGRHNLSNILAGCAVALHLGIQPERLPILVADIKPVQHRLSTRTVADRYTILDDAFNANPIGSKMALEVLRHFDGNQKIIITPGMIELGSENDSLNQAFGEAIADVCDEVILVGPKLTLPIQNGLANKHFPEQKIHLVKSIHEAYERLGEIASYGDVVLIENDLPDAFNEAL